MSERRASGLSGVMAAMVLLTLGSPPAARAYGITGTYHNWGVWNDSLYIFESGNFINEPGAVLQSSQVAVAGKLENRPGAVINNYTSFANYAGYYNYLYNYGAFSSFSGSSLSNSGTLKNFADGTLTLHAGTSFHNQGSVDNSGMRVNDGAYSQDWANITGAPARRFSNTGTLNNGGSMTILVKTAFTNGGTLTSTGSFSTKTNVTSNSGQWLNAGVLTVTGTLGTTGTDFTLANLVNTGTFTNTGTLSSVNGTIKNYATLVNEGQWVNQSSNYIGDWGRVYNYAGATLINVGSISANHVIDNAGALVNRGTIQAGYQFNNLAGGTLSNEAGATVQGPLFNHGTADNAGAIDSLYNHGHLSNQAGGLVGGTGVFENAVGAVLVNQGVLSHRSAMFFASTSYNAGLLTNLGTLQNDRSFYNSGVLENRGSFAGYGNFVQTGGRTENSGSFSQTSIEIAAGDFYQFGRLAAGSLTNAGLFVGSGSADVGQFVNSGTLAAGVAGLSLDVAGQFTQASGGRLLVQFFGDPADGANGFLQVAGAATLAGGLQVDLYNGFVPELGARYNLVHADAGLMGSFESLALAALPEHTGWKLDYSGTDLWLSVVDTQPVPEPATALLWLAGAAGLVAHRRRCLV